MKNKQHDKVYYSNNITSLPTQTSIAVPLVLHYYFIELTYGSRKKCDQKKRQKRPESRAYKTVQYNQRITTRD